MQARAAGIGTRCRVCLVSRSVHATLYQVFDRELTHLLDVVLAGDVIEDRETAERLVRTLGALVHLHGKHPIDAHGRCTSCRPPGVRWWPWRRAVCTVHTTLSYFLRQPPDTVINTLTEPKPHRVSQ